MLRLDRVFSLAEDVAALLPPEDLPVYGGDEPAADGSDVHDDAASATSSAAPTQAASGFKEPHRWAQAGDAPNAAVHARRLKIVGQEKGGLILYAYDARAPNPVRGDYCRPRERKRRPLKLLSGWLLRGRFRVRTRAL